MMNMSHQQHWDSKWTTAAIVAEDDSQKSYLLFKGQFFELSPIIIPLSIIVIVQNSIIFISYYKDKAKLVPSLFMGIALADFLKAQGEFVLSVTSILVYKGVFGMEVMYKSLYYYMATALPGINCSTLYNVVLSVLMTCTIVNPFFVTNVGRWRRAVLGASVGIVLLHLVDTLVTAVVGLDLPLLPMECMILLFNIPGLLTAIDIFCKPDNTGVTKCTWDRLTGPDERTFLFSAGAPYYILPPLIVLVCMTIQIKYLRRSLSDPETVSALPVRHVSITVLLVSTLFFFCHVTFFTGMIIWAVFHGAELTRDQEDSLFIKDGILFGLGKFMLPLVYSVAYPVILMCRKQELRERYAAYYRKLLTCCRN